MAAGTDEALRRTGAILSGNKTSTNSMEQLHIL
jgi:hypothetical protein